MSTFTYLYSKQIQHHWLSVSFHHLRTDKGLEWCIASVRLRACSQVLDTCCCHIKICQDTKMCQKCQVM